MHDFQNIHSNKTPIKNKVFTKSATENLIEALNSIQAEEIKVRNTVSKSLYEISNDTSSYSGPSFNIFNQHYKFKNYRADRMKILLQFETVVNQTNTDDQANNPDDTNEGNADQPKQEFFIFANITFELNAKNKGESHFSVASLESSWVDGKTKRLNDIVKEIPNGNKIENSMHFEHAIQILFATSITIFCVYLANNLPIFKNITFSEIYIFIISFILFSNLWTYASKGILALRNFYFPSVDIISSKRKSWLVILTIMVTTSFFGWTLNYIWELLFKSTP